MSTLTQRQDWLMERVKECTSSFDNFKDDLTWEQHIYKMKNFAKELLYACTEWEKYYKDSENK